MEWISVKERFPFRRERVLVSSKDGYFMEILFYYGENQWEDCEKIYIEDITHWMPLPKSPSKEV